MQDLNTIIQQNAKNFGGEAEQARRDGKTVVIEKQGLHVVGFQAFNTKAEAEAHAATYNDLNPSANSQVLEAL